MFEIPRKEWQFTVKGWTFGIGCSPGWLMFDFGWETSPPTIGLTLPFLNFWIERDDTDYRVKPWQWGWSLFRLTIWKTEFRLDVDLNLWGIGITCLEIDDFGIYFGPLNIQIETNKMFDVAFPDVPTLRLFFPPDRSV